MGKNILSAAAILAVFGGTAMINGGAAAVTLAGDHQREAIAAVSPVTAVACLHHERYGRARHACIHTAVHVEAPPPVSAASAPHHYFSRW